jgi:hypothetical protein
MKNMNVMMVTLAVFQAPIGWLNVVWRPTPALPRPDGQHLLQAWVEIQTRHFHDTPVRSTPMDFPIGKALRWRGGGSGQGGQGNPSRQGDGQEPQQGEAGIRGLQSGRSD